MDLARSAHAYDVWDDDPSSPLYNEWVDDRYADPGADPEPMDVSAYDFGAVIGYNTARTEEDLAREGVVAGMQGREFGSGCRGEQRTAGRNTRVCVLRTGAGEHEDNDHDGTRGQRTDAGDHDMTAPPVTRQLHSALPVIAAALARFDS
jgi:hypothetical protein